MNKLRFGAAYYEEYLPYDRLDEDVRMMKKAGINTVRIAESTWSTCEPQEGIFDFSHVERVLDAMEAAGIDVIIGTPTYAIPTWLVRLHPDILAETKTGRGIYGSRQIMDITHPAYLSYGERVIRKLMEHTAHRKCVIGFQIDNETKHYGTAGKHVQGRFVQYLQDLFEEDLDRMNRAFGLDYWSNRINAWEDFPDVRGTINGSLGAEFEKFQRSLVDEFLAWQASIVNEYRREDQFITHNFDYEWRGYSFGVQPDVDQYHAADCLTMTGVDIYHPTQDHLTGAEIAFGGDIARSLKNDRYLVLETQAQGFPGWTPYRGQLRLQAYSHLASGACGVMYWHWHSIHNACETYWKGLLSHDFMENETYREACCIGREFREQSERLAGFRKQNRVAILVSNESLTALNWFGIQATAAGNTGIRYNDVVRWIYDALYRMNIECDILWPESKNLKDYRVILTPALYSASDDLLVRLKEYAEGGGTLISTFKTGFADEYLKVSHEVQPRILRECFGVTYHQFTFPEKVGLVGEGIRENSEARVFMELLMAEGAEVWASYDHYNWQDYAAVTCHSYGEGRGIYIGCMTDEETLEAVLTRALEQAEVPVPREHFPVIVKKGINSSGREITFYLNYSPEKRTVTLQSGEEITIPRWGLEIREKETRI